MFDTSVIFFLGGGGWGPPNLITQCCGPCVGLRHKPTKGMLWKLYLRNGAFITSPPSSSPSRCDLLVFPATYISFRCVKMFNWCSRFKNKQVTFVFFFPPQNSIDGNLDEIVIFQNNFFKSFMVCSTQFSCYDPTNETVFFGGWLT